MAVKFEKRDGYILAVGEGVRNDLTSMIESTKKTVAAAESFGVKNILADYRKVKYNVPLTEAYNIVKVYETRTPEIRDLRIAGVINIEDMELIKFWESVSNRRGFEFKIFLDMDAALKWLVHTKSTLIK